MNNEPVAWMDDFGNVFEMKNQFFHIPLYTAEQLHPAKTLTDEEIKEVLYKWDKNGGTTSDASMVNFARAILRKAQEK